jgi:hypothetical protein
VIHEAEKMLRNQLRSKSLRWLYDQASIDFTEERKEAVTKWIMDL